MLRLDYSSSSKTIRARGSGGLLAAAVLFAFFFSLACALQHMAGAYRVELSGYPDEPGHFVSGVLVDNYLTTFPPLSPIRFAKEFYIHRPKVAIGHWPPVMYLIEGLWFVLFHVSRGSVLALMALICACVASTICHVVRRWYGTPAGIAAGALFVCLGFVQTQTSEVMTDMLVTLFGFWATLAFADFLGRRRGRDIFRFAIFALLAIFTKESGLYLALTCLIAVFLTRQYGVLQSAKFWMAGALVAMPTAAWILWTRKLLPGPMYQGPAAQLFLRILRMDLSFLYLILGPALLILITAGIVHDLMDVQVRRDFLSPTLISAAIGVLLFESMAAVQGVAAAAIEPRFLLPAVAALIPLLFSGLIWLARRMGPRRVPPPVRATMLLVAGVLTSPGRTFSIAHKPYRGFSEVADYVQSHETLRQGAVLVSSAIDGEGLLVSEIAMRYPCSQGFVVRASKLLGRSDWLGRDYQSRFESEDELSRYLENMRVDLVVIEEQAGVQAPKHQALLLQMVRERPDRWQFVGIFPARRPADLKQTSILVYRRNGGEARPADDVHREMEKVLLRMFGDG